MVDGGMTWNDGKRGSKSIPIADSSSGDLMFVKEERTMNCPSQTIQLLLKGGTIRPNSGLLAFTGTNNDLTSLPLSPNPSQSWIIIEGWRESTIHSNEHWLQRQDIGKPKSHRSWNPINVED